MVTLFAQPYNIHAQGFYFETAEDYDKSAKNCVDTYGVPIEEFEIQFIDGEDIDCRLFQAWGVYQKDIYPFFDALDTLNEHEKIALIAMAECGYTIDGETNTEDIELHYCENLEELAYRFVDEGLYGPIPESISRYIDYEAIAQDLGFEYSELRVANQTVLFRCP